MSMIDRLALVCAAALAVSACDASSETAAFAANEVVAPAAEAPAAAPKAPKRKIALTYAKYEEIARLLVLRLRMDSESVTGGMAQRDLVAWYLRHQQENDKLPAGGEVRAALPRSLALALALSLRPGSPISAPRPLARARSRAVLLPQFVSARDRDRDWQRRRASETETESKRDISESETFRLGKRQEVLRKSPWRGRAPGPWLTAARVSVAAATLSLGHPG
jgi:hypothetical protein